jgi:uncharacterized protein with HEPN domain
MTAETSQVREAHVALAHDLHLLGEAARSLPDLAHEQRGELRDRVVATLREQVVPHMMLDERVLYPQVADRLDDPLATASMAYDHLAIRYWINLIAEAALDDPVRLQELLYGLDALIAVHVWKENELYLAMLESPSWPAATTASLGPA